MQKKKYMVGGREWNVSGWEVVEGVGVFPILEVPQVSDYRWQLEALESRLQHPEYYENREDMAAVIEGLKKYLEENRAAGEKEGLYERFRRGI